MASNALAAQLQGHPNAAIVRLLRAVSARDLDSCDSPDLLRRFVEFQLQLWTWNASLRLPKLRRRNGGGVSNPHLVES
jgi:hypothetical protein